MLAAGLFLAACGAPPSDDPEPTGGSGQVAATDTGTPRTPPTTISSSRPPASPPPGRVTVAVAGDIHFAGRLEPVLAEPQTALAEVAPHLEAADVAVVNLESAVTEGGTPAPKQFHFRAPPTALDALAAAGADVVTMANNHGVDYGGEGLQDTLAAAGAHPLPVVGIGADAGEAFAPALLDVRGTTVAVLGASQVPDWTVSAWAADDDSPGIASARDPARLVAAVEAARDAADVVVVYLHWGTERQGCPDADQRDLTPRLVEAGADVIVGTHAHRLLGSGWWAGEAGEAYVNYGLGNFVWWRSNGENAVTTGVLTLTLDGRRVTGHAWTPMRIGDDGIPRVVPPEAFADAVRAWEETRGCTELLGEPPGS